MQTYHHSASIPSDNTISETHNCHVKDSGRYRFFNYLNLPYQGNALYEKLYQGLEYETYVRLYEFLEMKQAEMNSCLKFATATVKRRKGKHFSLEESDRLYRIIEIINAAIELFEGDERHARNWLKHPIRGLNHRRPIDMAVTSAESQAALSLIGQLEHGVFT